MLSPAWNTFQSWSASLLGGSDFYLPVHRNQHTVLLPMSFTSPNTTTIAQLVSLLKTSSKEWQHLQAVPAFCCRVTADLAQGGCHKWGNCPLEPFPGGTQYSFTDLEHQLVAAVWPSWLTVIKNILQYLSMVSVALFFFLSVVPEVCTPE